MQTPSNAPSQTPVESLLNSLPPILEGEQAFADGDLERAAQRFQVALERDPTSVRALANLGVVLFADGQTEPALEAFDAVLARDPRNADAHFNRAQVLVAENRLREGAAALRRCLAVAPGDSAALGLLEALDLPRSSGGQAPQGSTPGAPDQELLAVLREHAGLDGELADATLAPQLSIVFISRGDSAETLAFLDALQLEFPTPTLLEVFVVDDRADANQAHPLDALAPRFSFHHIPRKAGDATQGWAVGAQRASASAVLFLEAGALPDAAGLRAHVLAALRSEDAGWGPIGESPAAAVHHGQTQGSNLRLPLGAARTLAQEHGDVPLHKALERAVTSGRLPQPKALGAEYRMDGVGPLERPVFLFGCAYRSGSTFLQRLISSSEEIFVWGENMAVTRPLVQLDDQVGAWDFERFQDEQWRDFEANGLKAWICSLQPRSFPSAIDRALRAFYLEYYAKETQALGASRWGFKEVHHGGREAELLLRLFPQGRAVFVLRNPVDVLASTSATEWYDLVGPAQRVLDLWAENSETMLALQDERVLVVRYEDLLHQPERQLQRIAKHLSLPPEAFDRELLGKRVRGQNGTPKLGPAERAALSKPAFQATARRLGYTLCDHPALTADVEPSPALSAAPTLQDTTADGLPFPPPNAAPLAPLSDAPRTPLPEPESNAAPAPSEPASLTAMFPFEAPAAPASAEDPAGAAEPSHRARAGGMWEALGALQFDFLTAAGLAPDDVLLDVGCGALRGGVRFIEFLERGHYLGLDKDSALIEAGLVEELSRDLDRSKRPDLQVNGEFDCTHFRKAPTHALGLSLFTELPAEEIERCLAEVAAKAAPGCRFFATFSEAPESSSDGEPFHYTRDEMEQFGARNGWEPRYIGGWDHPDDERMIEFRLAG